MKWNYFQVNRSGNQAQFPILRSEGFWRDQLEAAKEFHMKANFFWVEKFIFTLFQS